MAELLDAWLDICLGKPSIHLFEKSTGICPDARVEMRAECGHGGLDDVISNGSVVQNTLVSQSLDESKDQCAASNG